MMKSGLVHHLPLSFLLASLVHPFKLLWAYNVCVCACLCRSPSFSMRARWFFLLPQESRLGGGGGSGAVMVLGISMSLRITSSFHLLCCACEFFWICFSLSPAACARAAVCLLLEFAAHATRPHTSPRFTRKYTCACGYTRLCDVGGFSFLSLSLLIFR